LADWAARVAEALGVDNALFHLEFRICGGRPYVIELGARMPGDQIAHLVELSTGVSLADVLVELATGTKQSDARGLHASFARIAAIRFFRDANLDELTKVPSDADLLAGPCVQSAGVSASVGDRPNVHADFRSRLGWVVLTADDRPALEQAWQQVAGRADFG
jgi:biotin carboxylase